MRGDERTRKVFELLAVSLELRNEGIRAVCFIKPIATAGRLAIREDAVVAKSAKSFG